MEKKDGQQKKVTERSAGGKQTDLAEGELETVEESIRAHEQKGDLPPSQTSKKHARK